MATIIDKTITLPVLREDVLAAGKYLDVAANARQGLFLNSEGGDVGMHGSARLVLRHIMNYFAAGELAAEQGKVKNMLDVGCGTAALSAWTAQNLRAELHVSDHDSGLRNLISKAFPEAHIHAELPTKPLKADLVMAMEVIEHITPAEQAAFVTELCRQVAPGGLLILSTPDESAYPGGWSGYGPHIGCLNPGNLEALLKENTDGEVRIWRLQGEPYRLQTAQRYLEPVANRSWNYIQKLLPELAQKLGSTAGITPRSYQAMLATAEIPEIKLTDPFKSPAMYTGLLAVVSKN